MFPASGEESEGSETEKEGGGLASGSTSSEEGSTESSEEEESGSKVRLALPRNSKTTTYTYATCTYLTLFPALFVSSVQRC